MARIWGTAGQVNRLDYVTRRLLQTEQDTPKPWRETGGKPRRVVTFVQRPQPLVPDPHDSL